MNKYKKIFVVGMLGITASFALTLNANRTENTLADKVNLNLNDKKNSINADEVIWENDGTHGDPYWGGDYRYSSVEHSTGEEIYAIPMDQWEKIKTGTFYLDMSGNSPWIRVTTGWWSTTWTGDDILPGNERLIDLGGGNWTLVLNFSGEEILDYIDVQHLLFTGSGYTPQRLYFKSSETQSKIINKRDPHVADLFGGYLKADKKEAIGGDTVAVEVFTLKGYKYVPDSFTATYGDSESCEITKVDDTHYTFVMPNADVSISCHFKAMIYQVSFDLCGHGSAIEPIDVRFNRKFIRPNDPTETGWVFVGWYKDSSYTEPWDFDNDVVIDNTTLFAKWTPDSVKWIVLKEYPTKTEYLLGEELDLTNLKISIKKQSGSFDLKSVTKDMISGYDKNKLGRQTVVITYEGKTTSYEIIVIAPPTPPIINNDTNIGLIVGATVGGIVGVGLIVLAIVLIVKKNKKPTPNKK